MRSISVAARSRVAALLSGARLNPPTANWNVRQASSCSWGGGQRRGVCLELTGQASAQASRDAGALVGWR